MCGPYSVPVGSVDVPAVQRGVDFVQPDVLGVQLVRIHLHAHGILLLPHTCTCATPETIEMRCAISVSAYSSSSHMRQRVRW